MLDRAVYHSCFVQTIRPALSMINNTRLDVTTSHKHLDPMLFAMLDALSGYLGQTLLQTLEPALKGHLTHSLEPALRKK